MGAAKEGLYIDFKQKAIDTNGELSEDDKKNFSKLVSAFANLDGGVIVWGIETQLVHGCGVRPDFVLFKEWKSFNRGRQIIRGTESWEQR